MQPMLRIPTHGAVVLTDACFVGGVRSGSERAGQVIGEVDVLSLVVGRWVCIFVLYSDSLYVYYTCFTLRLIGPMRFAVAPHSV